jgi:NAD dependent epimerase/dehydratase
MAKILVTGAAGFIGSQLVEQLVVSGFEVSAFVRYNSKSNWGWLENSNIVNNIKIISGDIRDYDSVYDAVKGCDWVFHLAALIGIPYSYISPLAYLKTNIEGTYNVLEASRKLSISNLIVTSTSETYGSAQFVPIHEEHPVVGQSPYSATKIAADHLALSYYRSFNLPVKVARPFNTYGPRQSARAFIPTVISQIASGKKKLHLGNLTPTRDLTYVKDTVNGFLEIAKTPKLDGQITNIGMNTEISMHDLVLLIAKLMNETIEIVVEEQRVRPGKSEVRRLFCDNSKILKFTQWNPKYTLEKGLIETIDWVKNNLSTFKPELYNL